ncbi:MAG TPA: radical SAM protein [Polyangiaceae bacterium]|nr:radical SAM protein [Polyangiaceae bacterium]
MLSESTRRTIETRLADERGRLVKSAPLTVALAYPSPYNVAMSSLGYQQIYRLLMEMPGVCCERAFLPDGADRAGLETERPVTYETLRGLSDFPIIALSVAYELELSGLIRLLEASGIEPLRTERGPDAPFILCGGPLTFSNPLPLAAFADAVVMGEGEDVVQWVVRTIGESSSRAAALATLAEHPNVFVPEHHGDRLAKIAACDDAILPAVSTIVTPHTELSNMFLIEAERGCSRGCTYCVMRRSTNGGMRIVPEDVVLAAIPHEFKRVGLVGAAVGDHPKITNIVNALADRGCEVGLSSLRPDKLKDEFVAALRRAGYRTLTTALDGPSERMRNLIERRGREPHYQVAAENARRHGYDRLKLYLMVGLPGEADEDIDECVRFVSELSKIIPIALGVAPFCAKRNTPLDRMPYAGIRTVENRLERLRKGLRGRADVRAVSAKWAWVEYVLAQGGVAEALALYRAVKAGGHFAAYRKEMMLLGHSPDGRGYAEVEAPIAPERLKHKHLQLARPS